MLTVAQRSPKSLIFQATAKQQTLLAAAIRANALQLKTLLKNGGLPLCGTCINVGCVPSKFLIRTGNSVRHAMQSPFGTEPKGAKVDFSKIIQQKKELATDMQRRKYLDLLADMQTLIGGYLEFVDGNSTSTLNKQALGML